MYNYPYGDNQQINLNWIISEIIALHQQLDPDYTAPTFTQIYPFSETQQLNLDWILAELKALKELAPTPSPTEEIDEIGQALIAGAYDADTQYQKNDYIVQDGKVYRANAATTGTFDSTKWNEVMLGNDLAIITRWADATNTYLNNLAASNVSNDSSVAGDTVKDALGNLNGAVNNEKDELNAIQNYIIIEQGGIADATGKDADNETRLRTNGFLPPYFTIIVAQPTTYDIRVKGTYYYDENNNFIQYIERNSYSVTVDSATNPNKYKVRLSFWANDSEQAITPNDLVLARYQVTDGIQTQIDNLNSAINDKYDKTGGTLTGNIDIANSNPYLAFKLNSTDEYSVNTLMTYPSESNRFVVRERLSGQGNYEAYKFPIVDSGLSTNKAYDILTTKIPVTIAQGGTGATSAGNARSNLGFSKQAITPIYRSGTSNVAGGIYKYGDIVQFSKCIKITADIAQNETLISTSENLDWSYGMVMQGSVITPIHSNGTVIVLDAALKLSNGAYPIIILTAFLL